MVLLEILGFFLSPFLNLLEPYVRQIYGILTSRTLRRKAVQGLVSVFVLFLIVGVALAAYLGFYWMYIPQRGHVAQVHLQYGPPVVAGMIGPKPSALVDFSRGGRVDQVLRGDQAYDISVQLVVPTSQHNVALGNFMVTVSLLDKHDRVLTTSSRPALLTYESLPVRWMRTLWRAIPLVLLWSKEAQTIKVPVLERFLENSAHPVSQALVEISTGQLQIYKCTLNVDAHFQGLRYFMYYHRVSTAIVFMSLFVFWEIVFTVMTWQLLNSWFGHTTGDHKHHALTVQDPQLVESTRLHLDSQNEEDGQRSLFFRGDHARRSVMSSSFTSGRRQGQIPALGPIRRQPQLQEDAYFISESEGSEESPGGTDGDDEEELVEDEEEEEEEEEGVPSQLRKSGSTATTEDLQGLQGSASAGPDRSDEPGDAIVPGNI